MSRLFPKKRGLVPPHPRWYLLAAVMLALPACARDQEEPHESLYRFGSIQRLGEDGFVATGQSGLSALAGSTGDPFGPTEGILLDERFDDLSAWQIMGEEDRDDPSFTRVPLAGSTGGGVLRVTPGFPLKANLMHLKSDSPVTVCARVRFPPRLTLEDVGNLLGVMEIKKKTRARLRGLSGDSFVRPRNAWQEAGREGGWVTIVQAFTPATSTGSLMFGFNTESKVQSRFDELLIDRIRIRSATVPESAVAMVLDLKEQGASLDAPLTEWIAGGESRVALISATPGSLSLPLSRGAERILRFGFCLPAAGAEGHSKSVQVTVRMEAGEGDLTTLLEERVKVGDPRPLAVSWQERSLRIPAVARNGRILLEAGSADSLPAIVVWGAPLLVATARERRPPNVILVSIDTLRAGRLGAYGGSHPQGVSPFIDELVQESLLFEQAMAQAPFTLPSHVSMLSGQYPTVHKVFSNDNRIDPVRTPLLAPILADSGYVTGAYTGGLYLERHFGFDVGFDTYFEREPVRGGGMARVQNWIFANGSEPFFLFFHTYAVHHSGFDSPEYIQRFDPDCKSAIHNLKRAIDWREWIENTDRHTPADLACLNNRYAAGIRMADDRLRQLMTFLDARGMLDQTLLVITSDHGKELLDRGDIQHGHTLYEELIHVPLIIRPPGGTEPRRIQDLVEVLDLPPTILDLLGLPIPTTIQGRSLGSLVDAALAERRKTIAFSEVDSLANLYALRTSEWKIIYTPPGTDAEAYELYHLTEDPGERNDAKDTASFETYRRRMDGFRKDLTEFSDSLTGESTSGGEFDPDLLDELKAHGYIK